MGRVIDVATQDGPLTPASSPARRVAPGGWRRGLVGVTLGVVVGLVAAAAMRRDEREIGQGNRGG